MGTVYQVQDQSTDQRLALKLHRESTSANALWFRREYHTLARLHHPAILEVHDFGVDPTVGLFYTMELLGGQDLRKVSLPMSLEQTARILCDVSSALAFLHSRRLVHRDLSPGNICSAADGRAKLIDFGVLATPGVCQEVAGTPPFIAPESLRGLPIDHRVDLFGLGALGYWMLTGRHAYPARTLDDLDGLWLLPLAPPSALVPGIPEAIDTLVLSLLNVESAGRPQSAAEVIDRLTAVTNAPYLTDTDVSTGYLGSVDLVGRVAEVRKLRTYIKDALDGNGHAVLLEAPLGTGKTRLIQEVDLEAQLAGATVLSAGNDSASEGPLGVLNKLARDVLAKAPQVAMAAAAPYTSVISRVVPGLKQAPVRRVLEAEDPADARLELQTDLARWFVDISAQQPLVILVDDIQDCDEGSAAVLAALAHGARSHAMLVVVALSTEQPAAAAAAAVASIRNSSVPMRLRGLHRQDVKALIRGLFGEVQNATRLAEMVHRVAGGSPLLSMEIARQLVDRSVIRFVDGMWVVPDNLPEEQLPRGLIEAMDARVDALSPQARALAQLLSVHGGELTLELCSRSTVGQDRDTLFASLDELQFEEIVIGAGDHYRIRHECLREAFLRRLAPERRQQLHLAIGEACSPMARSRRRWRPRWAGTCCAAASGKRGAYTSAAPACASTRRSPFGTPFHRWRPPSRASRLVAAHRASAWS